MELDNSCQAIELALTTWKPSVSHVCSDPEDPVQEVDAQAEDARMQSIRNNAEAYRHSAFVYLYRTIRLLPRTHALVQKHTHLSLTACSNVVNSAERCHDGPMSALLWPLFVAACEAVTKEDREKAMGGFGGTERRQGMHNIRRAWEVVQEVWRRADEGEEEVDWRGICEDRGYNIVFG